MLLEEFRERYAKIADSLRSTDGADAVALQLDELATAVAREGLVDDRVELVDGNVLLFKRGPQLRVEMRNPKGDLVTAFSLGAPDASAAEGAILGWLKSLPEKTPEQPAD